MDTDDKGYGERGPDHQTICNAIRRAVDDGCAATYFSLDRLLAAMRPVEERDELRAVITSNFAVLGRPVPRDAYWHMVLARMDGVPDGTCRISTKPDFVL